MIRINLHWLRRSIRLSVLILMAFGALHFSPVFFIAMLLSLVFGPIYCGKCTKVCPMNIDLSACESNCSCACIACMECYAHCPVKGALKIAARPAVKSDQNRDLNAELKKV